MKQEATFTLPSISKRLTISWETCPTITVRLDDNVIGTIEYKQLKLGKDFVLPDGSFLRIRFGYGGVVVFQNASRLGAIPIARMVSISQIHPHTIWTVSLTVGLGLGVFTVAIAVTGIWAVLIAALGGLATMMALRSVGILEHTIKGTRTALLMGLLISITTVVLWDWPARNYFNQLALLAYLIVMVNVGSFVSDLSLVCWLNQLICRLDRRAG